MDVSVEKQFKEKKSRSFLYSGMVLFVIILLSFFGYLNFAESAVSPSIITYQGKLLNGGIAVTTTQAIAFVLYDDPIAGNALYSAAGTTSSPSTVSTTVSDGFFTVDLGDTGTNSLDPTIFKNNQTVYLKVIIGGETLSPRKRITASPFAINSRYLDGIGSSSTPQSSAYIPVSDSSGNFNLNNVSSTGINVTGNSTLATTTISSSTIGNLNATNATFFNATSTNSFWTNLMTAATGWFTDLFWSNATSTGNTYLNTLTTTGNTTLATTTISSSTIGSLNVTGNSTLATTTISSSTIGNLNATNATFFNATSTNSFWTNLLTAATGWFTDLFWGNATSTGNTYLNTLTTIGNTTLATTTISSSTIGNLNVTNDISVGGLLSVTGNSYFGTIASGTWNGGIISNLKGGTGQDTSAWTGFAKITGGVWSTSTVGINDLTNSSTLAILSNNQTFTGVNIFTATSSFATTTFNGYVGIGTSSPSSKLNIYGGTLTVDGPVNMEVAGSLLNLTSIVDARGMDVSGKYAYVVDDSFRGLTIVDLSKPNTPAIVSTFSNSTYLNSPRAIQVAGRYAYVVNYGSPGLTILDVSNVTSTSIVGYVSSTSMTTPRGLFISGKYAYVASANFFGVVDISNPSLPALVNAGSTGPTLDGDSVYVIGKYAYVTSYTYDRITIFDISNPNSPTIVGSTSSVNLNGARSIFVSGKYAYITAELDNSLVVVDVSNPTSPTTTGYLKDNTNLFGVSDVRIAGKYAYVTAISANKLIAIDISNKSSPYLVGSVAVSGANRLFVSGRYAYIATYSTGWFYIVDLGGADIQTANIGNIFSDGLTVWEDAEFGNTVRIKNSLTVGSGGIFSQGPVGVYLKDSVNSALSIFSVVASTTNALTIMGDGKIGVGTSTPSKALSVVGDIGITSGALYINNNNYSQYFVSSPGTLGQLWQSNGVTGTWANTNGVVGQTLTYNANGWESSSALLTVSTTYGFEGTVNPPASFVASGPTLNWTTNTTSRYAGNNSLQTPVTDHSSSSTLTNIIYLPNTTTISFWWKVSSEATRDFLIFCIDRPVCYANNAGYLLNNNASTTDANISGSVSWVQVTSTLSGGLHTLKWIYMKDADTIGGSDAGYLDEVFVGKYDDVQIQNNLTVNTQVLIGTSTFGSTGYKLIIDSGSSSGAGVGVNGYIKATGFITGTTTLDLAETYPVNPLCEANGTCPTDGDVVCSDPTVIAGVKKCLVNENFPVIGIVSANPGFLLGGGDFSNPNLIGSSVKVALAGRVPVKVSAENGPIISGDKLTLSSIDGVATKAVGEAVVLGIAMENFSGSEIGSVVAFVNLGWQNQLYKALTIDTNTSTLVVGSAITPFNLALSGEFTMFNSVLNKLVFNATALFETNTNESHAFIFNATNFGLTPDKYLLSLRSNNDPRFSVMANGDVRASGNLYAASAVFGTSSNPGDLAERVDIASDDIVEPGDVLVVDMNNPDTYRRNSGANEQAVAGVVSTNPTIVVGNGKTEYTSVMAMVGRVPLKVSDENGAINRGDLLVTASSSGYAMKYDPKKDDGDKMIGVVGVALDSLSTGKGKIMALVRTGWVNSKYESILGIKENIQQLATAQGITLGATSTKNLNIESNSNGELSYSGGNLNLQGNNVLNVASITGKNNRWLIDEYGHFITKINTSQGEKDMYAMQSPTSEFVFSSSSQLIAGEAKIVFDQSMQDIIDSSQPLKINITLTSGDAKGIFVYEKNILGFTVKELDNGVSNATFDWMVVAKRNEQSEGSLEIQNPSLESSITTTVALPTTVDLSDTTNTINVDESSVVVVSSTLETSVAPIIPNVIQEILEIPIEVPAVIPTSEYVEIVPAVQ